ncbi:FecR family protein [Derxia gummosa]|uniref:FecR family protein n=1 Tax=Derxia gummosa DSM 723 TaxID=1121388 RepID=A0A8B6X3D6_9BURK|nr:FecR domain-containing protein [Derxia gummosa]
MPISPARTAVVVRARRSAIAAAAAAIGFGNALAAPPALLPVADTETHILTVERGDTLIGIARRLLANRGGWREIARLNRMADPDVLPTGSQLRIPLDRMAARPMTVEVIETVGHASLVRPDGSTSPLARGTSLGEGDRIDTGADGYATLRLGDGSLLRVQAESSAEVARARNYAAADTAAASLRLLRGRVEALVARLRGGQPHFDVRTPQATLAVRGTEFRVSSGAETHGEVVHGLVDARGGAEGKALAAGYGTVIGADGRVAEPVALLPAPDLSGLPAVFERKLLRISLPPLAGAAGWRVQVARDAGFGAVEHESVSATPELRIAGLGDGRWQLRVRAINAQGLEGLDAVGSFELHAEPEPPFLNAPAPSGKLRATGVRFAWTANPAATGGYRFQLAPADGSFDAPIAERAANGNDVTLDPLAPGRYRWRVASLPADGRPGPWGDAVEFTLAPPPAGAQSPEVDDDEMRFAWAGEPGQTFDFQLGRDAAMASPEVVAHLDTPRLSLPRPHAGGRFYLRYRAIDADGFIGPWTAIQSFDVDGCIEGGADQCWRSGAGLLTRR